MLNKDLKNAVDRMCDIVKSIGDAVEFDSDAGEMARIELGAFMMYLSASDGRVSREEAQAISEICRMNLAANDIAAFIQKQGIYSESYESTPNGSFKFVVMADQVHLEHGLVKRGDRLLSDNFIDIYKAVGEALLKSDNGVTQNEVRDYQIYTTMMERYQRQELG